MTTSIFSGLYAITPDGLDEIELARRVESALRGGAKLLQYRDKKGDSARRLHVARKLRQLCTKFEALLIINDDVSLATAVDADGVHLGTDDGDLKKARTVLGPQKILGASCYGNFDLARAARDAGADYVAFGTVFASPTKPHAVRAELSLFARCHHELSLPACAIGGITTNNAPHVIAAGADMVAVITDLFDAPDIEARARTFQSFFEGRSRDNS